MSNKKRRVDVRSESFSGRVCDDLSEVILQYLSLEDKHRFQCVSKQFQRTALQRHYELRIECRSDGLLKKSSVNCFESLMKKCPNIRSVYIQTNWYADYDCSKLDWISMVETHCPQVTKISFEVTKANWKLNENPSRLVKRVVESFGPRLKCLEVTNVACSYLFKHLDNIEQLKCHCDYYWNAQDHKFAKLSKLDAKLGFYDSKGLLTFIDNNPGIRRLSLSLFTTNPYYANSLFMSLSQLKALIHFEFIKISINNELLMDGLSQMALNCTQLKSIICEIHTNCDNYHKLNYLLSPLKKFPKLRRLELTFIGDYSLTSVGSEDYEKSPVSGLEKITHLSLNFQHYYKIMNEQALCSIISDMSELQHLKFVSLIEINKDTFDILTSLKRLESIELCCLNNQLVKELATHCESIKNIKITPFP